MTETSIRPATADDAAPLAEIYNYYVRSTVITFEEEEVAAGEMLSRLGEVQRLGLPWLVAERNAVVVGYCYASKWKARSAYRHSVESTIYLRNGIEGQSVGTKLYGALLDILRDRGVHTVIGGTALPNPASAALHERLGFNKVAEFEQVGFKLGKWVNVAYWQLLL